MLFNSFAFIFFFFPAVLAVALLLKGQRLLRWITLSSFVFYAFAGHAWFLIPMLVTTVLDFYLAPRIAEAGTPGLKKALLCVSLCGNLGLLFYFKYSGLMVRTAEGLAVLAGQPVSHFEHLLALLKVVLPAGISFYTFQTMSYVIDVYRGQAHAETNFWKFAGFVSFFPHLVAGPLTRHNQLIPALTRIAETGPTPLWAEGVYLFCVGLSKKVIIADRLANHVVEPLLDRPGSLGWAGAWIALLGYALQIYFDFSGYSDMAIGLGRLFGIELPQNFNSPYQAKNPSDFWKRWHMTLSSWLRDYLYISLGGNRCSALRRDFNLMATMVLGGLWHGANWTFAIWGFYHGLLLIGYHQLQGFWDRRPVWLQRAATFLLVTAGWAFFRAGSLPQALSWLRQLFSFGSAGLDPALLSYLPLLAGGLLMVNLAPNASSYERLGRLPAGGQVALGLATVLALLMINFSSRFLYFQF